VLIAAVDVSARHAMDTVGMGHHPKVVTQVETAGVVGGVIFVAGAEDGRP
jgi:uncharacterized protein YqfA (UPF0365 family)